MGSRGRWAAANILNKQSRAADKGYTSNLGGWASLRRASDWDGFFGTTGFRKMLANSSVAERLVTSREGLGSMELV
jgi:hypothetical protein